MASKAFNECLARRKAFGAEIAPQFLEHFGVPIDSDSFFNPNLGCLDLYKMKSVLLHTPDGTSTIQRIVDMFGVNALAWYIMTNEQAFAIKPNWELDRSSWNMFTAWIGKLLRRGS